MRPRTWFRLLALFAALGLFFAACSTEDDSSPSDDTSEEDEQESSGPATCQGTPGEDPALEPVGGGEGDGSGLKIGMVLDIGGVDDDSFNEAAHAGLVAAEEDFGAEVRYVEPNEDGSNRGELLRQLAQEDYDLVIGVGFLFAESMGPLADEFTDVNFAIIDDSSLTQSNVTPLIFAEEQGSFLVGAAAALASGTGQIGFIGGVNTELINKFEAGFAAGVAQIDEDAEVDARYITEPPDFAGFADPASARTMADDMFDSEIDVVYHAAGGSGGGLFEAAVDADRLAIGVDSDQYQQVDEATQPCILTSMLKRVDVAVYTAIENLVNDELTGGTPLVFDLENDGVGFATDGGQLADFEDELNDLRQQIIDGDIEVPTTP
ncbi:MAG: BMP family ABC transporter substrate-binding protein [Acidimicrobiales bacterium]|nr:BMP family ABC transporter substrate-binding protein [Acidimicrobiales bacterium]